MVEGLVMNLLVSLLLIVGFPAFIVALKLNVIGIEGKRVLRNFLGRGALVCGVLLFVFGRLGRGEGWVSEAALLAGPFFVFFLFGYLFLWEFLSNDRELIVISGLVPWEFSYWKARVGRSFEDKAFLILGFVISVVLPLFIFAIMPVAFLVYVRAAIDMQGLSEPQNEEVRAVILSIADQVLFYFGALAFLLNVCLLLVLIFAGLSSRSIDLPHYLKSIYVSWGTQKVLCQIFKQILVLGAILTGVFLLLFNAGDGFEGFERYELWRTWLYSATIVAAVTPVKLAYSVLFQGNYSVACSMVYIAVAGILSVGSAFLFDLSSIVSGLHSAGHENVIEDGWALDISMTFNLCVLLMGTVLSVSLFRDRVSTRVVDRYCVSK